MKYPILVIGNAPRCGSTAFAFNLHKKLSLPLFLEPWHMSVFDENAVDTTSVVQRQNFARYINYKKNSDQYICKFWISNLETRSPYNDEIKKGYKIGLMRRNLIDQVASWYIADYRKKFFSFKTDKPQEYLIKIDKFLISKYIYQTSMANFFIENSTIFDQVLYYEDLDLSILDTVTEFPLTKTFQPSNIDEVKYEISLQLKDTFPLHWVKK